MKFWVFIGLWGLFSCSHYTLERGDNPFDIYQVQRLAIIEPFNQTSFPDLGGLIQRHLHQKLSSYQGLKVTSKNPQALLVVVLGSGKSRLGELRVGQRRLAQSVASDALQNRSDFFIPRTNIIQLSARFIFIRLEHASSVSSLPSLEEIENMQKNSRHQIVFDRVLHKRREFVIDAYDFTAARESGAINYTQYQGALEHHLKKMSQEMVELFSEQVVHAF